ncbi:hypothetical protein DFJ63DRAFT_287179 [Scheffersomyces coipomensis]|uniref:uncharacterized protein n=1 Tax=Scheffersomyces coipomensis TaxID=1788519 RepID=UPI00315DCDD4
MPRLPKLPKFNRNPKFDVDLHSSIGFIDLQRLEYTTKTLQKNIRLIINDAPNLYQLRQILNSNKIDTGTKVELESNKYINLSAELKSKYEVGKLSIFDQIQNGSAPVSDEEFALLNDQHSELVDIKPPVELLDANTESNNTPIEHDNDEEDDYDMDNIPPLPQINDPHLLARVFIHKSTVNSKSYLDPTELINSHNERLEFLGDSVLNNLVTLMIYQRFPSATEGELTILRSHLIDNRTLAQFSFLYNFDKKLRANIGEDVLKSGDQKIYADIFEAYVGALSMERSNLTEIQEWLKQLYESRIRKYEAEQVNVESINKEAKSELYSVVGTAQLHPEYIVVAEGNGSIKDFEVQCKMGDEVLGTGRAPSQKDAGLRAAMSALKNRPILEKYFRLRMASDRKETVKAPVKKASKKSTTTSEGEERKVPRSPIRTGIFPLKANDEDPLDTDARNTLYAEIGKRIGEVPQYIVTKTATDILIVSLSIRGLVVVTATDKSKKKAMTRAAMTLLNDSTALNEICKDSFI